MAERTDESPWSSPLARLPDAERVGVPDGENFGSEMGGRGAVDSVSALSALMGTRWCGEVDQVPGLLYVATSFLHVAGVPLVPLRSWVVLLNLRGSRSAASAAIGWNLKSIAFAYLRAFLVLAAILFGAPAAGGLIGFVLGANGLILPTVLGACAAASWGLFLLTRRISGASEERARYLAMRAGFREEEAEAIANELRLGKAFEESLACVCPGCGREVANSTRVCPRCERRL